MGGGAGSVHSRVDPGGPGISSEDKIIALAAWTARQAGRLDSRSC